MRPDPSGVVPNPFRSSCAECTDDVPCLRHVDSVSERMLSTPAARSCFLSQVPSEIDMAGPGGKPLAQVVRLHGELDQLDRFGCEPEPSDSADPVLALATLDRMQRQLAKVRVSITAPSAPLTVGERAAATHHVQVIAASLGVLHKAYRKSAADSVASVLPVGLGGAHV